jgi:hypothetical protein
MYSFSLSFEFIYLFIYLFIIIIYLFILRFPFLHLMVALRSGAVSPQSIPAPRQFDFLPLLPLHSKLY